MNVTAGRRAIGFFTHGLAYFRLTYPIHEETRQRA
jgi:hypothetical protein